MSDQSNDQGRDVPPEYGTAPEGAPGVSPSEPASPGQPVYPGQPGYPGQAAYPGQPTYPGQPAYGQPAYGQPAYPSYPSQPMQYAYPESSQGVLALVLGIIGLFVVQLVAPFAWVVSNRELRGIEAGRRDPTNRGLAVAGKVMGIIGTILLAIGIVIFVVVIIVLVSASTSSSS